MLKILTTKQIKDLDAYTVAQEPIASIDLMERACVAFANVFIIRFDKTKRIGIVCGTGNNGADGLGIARLLAEWSDSVQVYVIRTSVKASDDFLKNFQRLPKKIQVHEIASNRDPQQFEHDDILIDAIF